MILSDTHTAYIRTAFQEMNSKEDFLTLLNYAKSILYGEKAFPFALKHLTYHSQHYANRYKRFEIKKKNGGVRVIHAPQKGLKQMQKCLNIIFNAIFQANEHTYGFVTGKSVVDNANKHTGMQYVYNVDLKDFFPSVEEKRIYVCLQLSPFKMSDNPSRKILAHIISRLCCIELTNEKLETNPPPKIGKVLPQGAPTSPILTNIVCQKLDWQLAKLAKYYGLIYSRYADDITFSSLHNVYGEDHKFTNKLKEIITSQGFIINESKVRLQKKNYRQEVTGLTVNEKANVQKRYIQQLRGWLYKWERYGLVKSMNFFKKDYYEDQQHVIESKNIKSAASMVNVIRGKLLYLKMVRGPEDELFKKLNDRFLKLINPLKDKKATSDLLNEVLETINVDGFEKGMDIYISKLKKNGPK